jgi:DNA-binding transcriptional LysR family regulator
MKLTGDARTSFQRLRYFLAVADTGNFTEAGALLGRTQAAVSAEVKKLEEELGTTLFAYRWPEGTGRKRRARDEDKRVPLTEDGKALLVKTEALARSWKEIEDHFLERKDGRPRGPLRVGAGEPVILYYLPQVVERFQHEEVFKDVSLVIRRQSLAETLQRLKSGELDVGIRSLPAGRVPDGLSFEPLVETSMAVVFPKGHRLASEDVIGLEQLKGHAFVVPWPYSSSRRLVESKMAGAGYELRVAMEAPGWESMKQYIALGMGIGVMPEFCITAGDRTRLEVRPAPDLFGSDRYGIVLREGVSLSAGARAFIRLVKAIPLAPGPSALETRPSPGVGSTGGGRQTPRRRRAPAQRGRRDESRRGQHVSDH